MRRLVRVAARSEPVLSRQSSIMSNLGLSMRRKMSSASQVTVRPTPETTEISSEVHTDHK